MVSILKLSPIQNWRLRTAESDHTIRLFADEGISMSKAVAKTTLRSDQPHPMLQQLDLALENQTGGEDCLDVSYMSRSFCLSGLPLRRQFIKDPVTGKVLEPRIEETVFSRTDGAVSLTIGSQPFVMPDKTRVTVGVPYGARARLLILWLTTQARATPLILIVSPRQRNSSSDLASLTSQWS